VCADTPEEALLKEFRDIASTDERKTLASFILRLVSK
jgi:hypothetical protein